MPKRRKKRRGKRREPQRQLPRMQASAPLPSIPRPGRVAPESRPDVVAARPSGPGTEGTVAGTVVGVEREQIWIDVDGRQAKLFAWDLMLGIGEQPANRYTVGDRFQAFVFQIPTAAPESGTPQFSIRQASPYPEALAGLAVGAEVQGTVVNTYDQGIELDIGGVRGVAELADLPLQPSESPHQRYEPGETVEGLGVVENHRLLRQLRLSRKRNVPGYVEALHRRVVGEVVSGTVTGLNPISGLWLDVDGVIGIGLLDELAPADRESAQERYTVGETIEGLFVAQVDSWRRVLNLSFKRNTPGYVEALQRYTIGEMVSGTITEFEGGGGLWLDVDGLVGTVSPQGLDLADGESAWERYTVGEAIDGLFVWSVNHNSQFLSLSLKRNAPSYVEALQRRVVGEAVSGPITGVEPDGLILEVHGLVGVIPASELQLDTGQSPQQRYSVGETIAARVWMIDRTSRTLLLSTRQHAAGFREEQVERGATIDAVVRGTTPRDVRMPIRVLTTYSDSSVEIPPHALSLSTGMPPHFEDNQTIRVVVVELDDEDRPTRLSRRQALDGWEAEMRRLSDNTVVPNARPVPPEALSDAERNAGAAAVDLGPIIGVIPEDELDRETGRYIATYNETYQVVVESVDDERRIATVSHERFEERWQAVAGQLELEDGAEVEGELRDFDKETALFDLGSGLLAQMPMRELPDLDPPGKTEVDRIGERFPLRITNIDPGKQTVHVEPRNQWLEALINEPESETLEFKAVLRGRGGEADRVAMTRRSIRTINAFVNTDGGRLIVGVHDKRREVLGLEADEGLLDPNIPKKIDIAFQVLSSNLKRFAARSQLESIDDLVTWRTESVRGKTLLIVECKRGPAHGVDLVVGDDQREFYVRDRDGTHALSEDEDIIDHLRKRAERATSP